MFRSFKIPVVFCVVCFAGVGLAEAAINIEVVTVGDPGNAGEWSGENYGGFGPDRVCGAVGYTYNIGKYEVTAGQYTAFLNAKAKTDTYTLYNSGMSNTTYGSGITRSGGGVVGNPYSYTVEDNFVSRPVNFVTFWDACRFTNWLHNGQGDGDTETGAYTLDGYNGADGRWITRNLGAQWFLPSEDEWYKAAYYKGGSTNAGYWDFPTKSDAAAPPGRDMADVSGNNANYAGSPSPIDSPYWITLVGEFHSSASPYGTFDQGGNVQEWNEEILHPFPYDWSRGMRGGSFAYDESYLLASARGAGYPSYDYVQGYIIGFRVASAVPEPATLIIWSLLGTLAIGAGWWKKRRAAWANGVAGTMQSARLG